MSTSPKILPFDENQAIQSKFGVALVGMGEYSRSRLLPALNQSNFCKLAAVVVFDQNPKEKIAHDFNISNEAVYNYNDFDKIRDNGHIQIVYIVVPNKLHREYTLKAAEMRKHVICEKPMATTVEDAREMMKACQKAGVRLFLGYRLQFNPFHEEIEDIAKTKRLGKIKNIKCANGFKLTKEHDSWRLNKELAGGGSLMDMGIYLVHACRKLAGGFPNKIKAKASTQRPEVFKEVEDTLEWTMEFPNDITAECKCSYSESDSFINVEAEKGSFSLNNAFKYDGMEGEVNGEKMEFPKINNEEQLLDHVAYSIRKDIPSPISGEEGIKDLQIISKIYESMESGREVNM